MTHTAPENKMSTAAAATRRWRIRVFGQTDRGQVRANNEDNFLIASLDLGIIASQTDLLDSELGTRGALLVVADGVGGANAGEVASRTAVESIHTQIVQSWDGGAEDAGASMASHLNEALVVTNRTIRGLGHEEPAQRGMASTCVVAAVVDGCAILCNVGDSRGYLIRNGSATQLTRDQSFVQQLIDAGVLKPDEAERSPVRHVVTEALGAKEELNVARVAPFELQDGDVLVLCSDGLSGYSTGEDMARIVSSTPDPAQRCRQLVDLANERGGRDNITVVVAELACVTPHSTRVAERVDALLNRIKKRLRGSEPVGADIGVRPA